MALEIQGKLHEVYPEQQITEKFKKREFVIEMDDNGYTQYVKFQLNQDRCSLIAPFKKGDDLKVAFNLTGRAYTAKSGETGYITNLVAWKLQQAGASAPTAAATKEVPDFQNEAGSGEGDDLPF